MQGFFCSDYYTDSAMWSAPRTVVKAGEKATNATRKNKTNGNTTLYRDDQGTIWLFYVVVPLLPFGIGGWSASHVEFKTSFDEGKTWSRGTRYIDDLGNLIRNKPIRIGKNQLSLFRLVRGCRQ